MPVLGYIHSPDPDDRDERPWEPNWRIWRWLAAAGVVGYGAAHSDGALEALLVFVVFGLCCRAALEALPDGDGLRHWRQ